MLKAMLSWANPGRRSARLISLVLILPLLLSVIAGCTGAAAPQASGGAAAPAESSEGTKLVFWIHAAEPFIKAHTEIIEGFEKENPGITVELQSFPFAEFGTKVAAEIPAGGGPDVVEAYGPWMSIYMRNGKLSPVPDSFLTPDAERSRYYASTLTTLEYDGKFYGVPSNVAAGSTRVALVNDAIVDEAGVDLSDNATFDDWIKDWQALTVKDDAGRVTRSGLGIYCGQTADLFVSYLMQFGGSVADETGHKAAFNSDAGRAALQTIADLVQKDQVDTIDITDFSCIPQGTAAMGYRGTWVIPTYLGEFPDFKWHYELLPLPTGATNEVWQGGAGWATFVPNGSKNQEAAWKFVQYLEDHRQPWIENTGEIPADKQLAATMAEANPALYGVYYPILEQSKHGYPYGDYFQIQSMFQDMVTMVLMGNATVDEALAQTEQTYNAQLDKWWKEFQQ